MSDVSELSEISYNRTLDRESMGGGHCGRLSVCLIRSRKHPELWTFPAGGVERGERHDEAALRETREEAGLIGRLGSRTQME